MKLFVDDLRPAPDGWTLANTIIGAITAIKQFDPEVISLDHDICHHIITVFLNNGNKSDQRQPDMVACAENFTAVAEYLVVKYKGQKHKPKIFIHTMNPVGAEKLKGILRGFEVERDFTYTPVEDRK